MLKERSVIFKSKLSSRQFFQKTHDFFCFVYWPEELLTGDATETGSTSTNSDNVGEMKMLTDRNLQKLHFYPNGYHHPLIISPYWRVVRVKKTNLSVPLLEELTACQFAFESSWSLAGKCYVVIFL